MDHRNAVIARVSDGKCFILLVAPPVAGLDPYLINVV